MEANQDQEQELRRRLKEFKVESDLDILTLNTELLLSRHGDVIDREQLPALVAKTREWHAARPITGREDLAKRLQSRQIRYETGISQIDKLLQGGFCASDVVQIAGRAGSGRKSLVFRILAQSLLSHSSARVLWMNTSLLGLDIERLVQVLRGRLLQSSQGNLHSQDSESQIQALLQRIEIEKIKNCDHAIDTISRLDGTLQDKSLAPLRLVVIDDLQSLFGQLLSSGQPQGNALLVTFLRMVRLLGQRHNVLFLLLNGAISSLPYNEASAFLSTRDRPALGRTLDYMTDMTLWLGYEPFDTPALPSTPTHNTTIHHRIVQLFYSRRQLDGQWVAWDT